MTTQANAMAAMIDKNQEIFAKMVKAGRYITNIPEAQDGPNVKCIDTDTYDYTLKTDKFKTGEVRFETEGDNPEPLNRVTDSKGKATYTYADKADDDGNPIPYQGNVSKLSIVRTVLIFVRHTRAVDLMKDKEFVYKRMQSTVSQRVLATVARYATKVVSGELEDGETLHLPETVKDMTTLAPQGNQLSTGGLTYAIGVFIQAYNGTPQGKAHPITVDVFKNAFMSEEYAGNNFPALNDPAKLEVFTGILKGYITDEDNKLSYINNRYKHGKGSNKGAKTRYTQEELQGHTAYIDKIVSERSNVSFKTDADLSLDFLNQF